MNYKMKIVLNSDICMGNGEGKGNSVDLDICTDAYGIPYIPARRLKGCLRETAEFLRSCAYPAATSENIEKLFGDAFGSEGILVINDAVIENKQDVVGAIKSIRKENNSYLREIVNKENIIKNYTAVRGQTRLNDGVKVDGTLRFTRVLTQYNEMFNKTEPVAFVSDICVTDTDKEIDSLLEACVKGTRHIGSHRNRGLGNISAILEKDSKSSFVKPVNNGFSDDELVSIEYRVHLDSPVSILEFGESNTLIPARSVIGCMGGFFSRNNSDEELFSDLFLNGTVKWSALTPVIDGRLSVPVPNFIIKLKNGDGKLINQFAMTDDGWKKLKPKSVEGSYASYTEDGYVISDVSTRVQYHNSISKAELYIQEAIEAGYIYGGTVTFPGKFFDTIVDIISNANLRFGRSKNVQYSNCRILSIGEPIKVKNVCRPVSGKIYVVFETDMLAMEDGISLSSYQMVRDYIVNVLDLKVKESNNCNEDSVRFGVIGGFQNMWHLQKMHTKVVKAGSFFCFDIDEMQLPVSEQIGENSQEDFGKIRIFTETEMNMKNVICRGKCDTLDERVTDQTLMSIKTALTRMVLREALLRYARDYKVKMSKTLIPVSRLRLMLQESSNYSEFIARVNTIKESDVSSQSEGRKKVAKDFITDFYGDEKNIDWQKMLKLEDDLYEKICESEATKALLEELWSLPLMTKLHQMHYSV